VQSSNTPATVNYWGLIRKFPRQLGYGYTHYLFSSLGQTFFISVFVESFSQELGMKNQGFSVLYAVATIASSFTLPFLGKVLDRVKLRNISFVNGLTLALFCLVVSFSSNRITLLFGLFGLRMAGQGMMALIGSAAIARNFSNQRGKALSLAFLGLSTGETVMPVIGVSLIGLVGWQHAWQVMSVLTLVMFVPIALFILPKNDLFHIPPLKKISSEQNRDDKSRKQVLKDFRFYLLVANTIFTPFFITGMFIHHNLLADIKGWSMSWIATCFVGYGVSKTISSLLAGPLVDRYSARKIFPFYLGPMALGALSLVALGNSPWVALIYLCLLAISVSLMSVSSTALWAELYGHTHFGAIKSMVTTVVVFASAIGPLVIGAFIGRENDWKWGLWACIFVIVLVGSGSYYALKKK
jgi:MFS family permease